MQNLKALRRRFPTSYPVIISLLFLILLALVVIGVGMLLVR